MGNLEKLLVVGVLVVVIGILSISLFWTNDVPTLPEMKSSSDSTSMVDTKKPQIPEVGLPGDSLAQAPKTNDPASTTSDSNVGMTPLISSAKNPQSTATQPAASQPATPGDEHFKSYTIKAGDTLDVIAKREKVKVAEILKANEGLDPKKLRVGKSILIPRDENASNATAPLSTTNTNEPAAKPTSTTPTETAKPNATTPTTTETEKVTSYTVEKGDTLTKISKKVYGDGNKWKKIMDANRDKLPTEKDLKPGMKLSIP